MAGVAFFDLDRTLLDVNSGHLWLRYEWRRGRVGAALVARGVWLFVQYAWGRADLDRALAEAAAVYRGLPADAMREETRAWFAEEVAPRLRPGARAAIDAHRAAGDHLVLATSSSHFAGGCAQEAWGLHDAISTELDIEGGVLTGRVANPGFGVHKRARCEAWAAARGVPMSDCAFYTDSISDLPLLEAVGRPVVVHPDVPLRAEARRRGWPVVDWGRPARRAS